MSSPQIRQIFDHLPDYKSAILPTLRQSADGLVQAVIGLEFDAPYASTTEDIHYALADATNSNGYLVTDDGAVSSYDILPSSATAVCEYHDVIIKIKNDQQLYRLRIIIS